MILSNLERVRDYCKWPAIVVAGLTASILGYVRWVFAFEDGDLAALLSLIAFTATTITLILGLAALPRWQGFVSVLLGSVAAYFILFKPLYWMV